MRRSHAFLPAVALMLLGFAAGQNAETRGIAARYRGDSGIDRDPAVLFHEDFESGDLKAWEEIKRPAEVVTETPHAGRNALQIPITRGKDTGGHLVKWFLPGADRVHARFYVRFAEGYRYAHHFVHLLANPKGNRWGAFGKAGVRPDGTYYTVGMEPWFAWGQNPPPGEVNLYAYFPDMEIDAKTGKYWGNAFFPPGPGRGKAAGPSRVIPPLGRWQCWEFMVGANSAPDRADGRMAMWVDGRRVGEFPGIRWRTDMEARINALWLLHYGGDTGDPSRSHTPERQSAWFDDIVVARDYIGPMVSP